MGDLVSAKVLCSKKGGGIGFGVEHLQECEVPGGVWSLGWRWW